MSDVSYVVKCAGCGRGNSIPADKEGLRGRCGNCGRMLPPLHVRPRQLGEVTFDDFVQSYPGPVLAEFWAPW